MVALLELCSVPNLLEDASSVSISSIKIIHGAFSRASLKRSRTRDGPTPTNISMKSEPLIEKKGTPASPATALARRVFPVPGGPHNRAPLGIFAPSLVNCSGDCKKSTNSTISFLDLQYSHFNLLAFLNRNCFEKYFTLYF